jgi:hypothetical protein
LIDKLEMVNALNEKGEGGGVFSKGRWEEADANADGSITSKEFLFIPVRLVGGAYRYGHFKECYAHKQCTYGI